MVARAEGIRAPKPRCHAPLRIKPPPGHTGEAPGGVCALTLARFLQRTAVCVDSIHGDDLR
jgi:hypothetical protein